MARKAADLYQQQQAIEQLVTQRWDSAAANGGGGPVQQLPAVQIDKFGRFPFVLAKAGDRLGARKLLVRGRNGATEAQLVNSILKEVRRPGSDFDSGQIPKLKLDSNPNLDPNPNGSCWCAAAMAPPRRSWSTAP